MMIHRTVQTNYIMVHHLLASSPGLRGEEREGLVLTACAKNVSKSKSVGGVNARKSFTEQVNGQPREVA